MIMGEMSKLVKMNRESAIYYSTEVRVYAN